ncbi:MAG: SH3 domain-containing protein [Anaerolineae bacterium]
MQLFNQGTYEFVASSDDGIRVFIDGVLVLDRFIGRVLTTDRFQQTMTAGTHSLTVEYVEFVDQAAVQFQWFQVSGALTPGLTPGVPGGGTIITTAVPACSGTCATVTGVRGLALRTGPYLGASFITTLPQDQTYTVLGRNKDEGIYNWYKLQVGERVGWASGRFLTLSVDLNTIPVVGSIFDEIDGAVDVGARAYPRAVMNLRSRPSDADAAHRQHPLGRDARIDRSDGASRRKQVAARSLQRCSRLGRCALGLHTGRNLPGADSVMPSTIDEQ